MNLEGLPGVTPTFSAFVGMVRAYLRDHAELNRLVAGQESSDRQIAWAIMDALADFNGTPPLLPHMGLEALLNQQQHALLLRMTVISLIESIGLLQTRNQIDYNNGSFSTAVNNKAPLLMSWLQYFRASTDQLKQRVKVALNIRSIMDPSEHGLFSEYWYSNGSYHYWF